MNYWPGTSIVKSQGNAFDWRNNISKIANSTEFKQSQQSTAVNAGNNSRKKKAFTIYSKAQKSK